MINFFAHFTRFKTALQSAPYAMLAGLGAVCGIMACLVLTGLVTPATLPAIVAPIGASSVLVFALPASPLATPRAVIGGNTLSAAIGIAIGLLIPNPLLAAGLAVGLAIVLMAASRTLHPPGGAAALTAVMLHPNTLPFSTDLTFPLLPVCLNSSILVGVGMLFHRFSGHSYPHRAPTVPLQTQQEAGLKHEDIVSALNATDDVFDIDTKDLERLLILAEHHAKQRRTP
ncbi:MAG: HPP family protein [Acetobacter orientalis]|uniref:HPP family protein n=1 Tax=Acetobacter orientalis TaxID=146474 RepID=UPI0039E8DC98